MGAVDSLRQSGMSRRQAQRAMREARRTFQPPWMFDPRCPRCASLSACDCFDGVPATVVQRWEAIMPLHYFDDEHRAWIAEQVSWDEPPDRYWLTGSPGGRPLAAMENRAWWEWHWSRGIYPEAGRRAIPQAVRAAVMERDGTTCQICFAEVEPADIHLDHIQPHSRGGRETVANLRVTHSLCNTKRGAPEAWHASE